MAWGSYNKEAHAGLADMYVADERFRAYYDQDCEDGAEFLRDAILIYTGKKKDTEAGSSLFQIMG